VTWKRSAGIWHHAIVVNVDAVTGQLEVVHYNGSVIRDEGQSSFASVRREWVSVSLRSRDLYRVDYDSRMVSCFSPEVVVQRAMSRINETEYNPLTHNCEHLARWCKTGQPRSVQVGLWHRVTIGEKRFWQCALATLPYICICNLRVNE
jgi:hypothetical protein